MKFNKVINEINLDTGQVGSFIDRMTDKEREEYNKKVKKVKRSKKRVFGSWFTNHNNTKHIN